MLQFPQMSSASEDTVRAAAVIDTTNLSGKQLLVILKFITCFWTLLLLVCIHDFIPWYFRKDCHIFYFFSAHEPLTGLIFFHGDTKGS